MAFFTFLLEINTDILISEVEMTIMLIFFWANDLNILYVMPGVVIIPTPMIDIFDKFLSNANFLNWIFLLFLINFSDFCVLPTSYREGTPRFLLEAMACSKPIITSNVPGCNHLIDKKNENGILLENLHFSNLAEALIRLSKKNLITLGENSFQLYKNKFYFL